MENKPIPDGSLPVPLLATRFFTPLLVGRRVVRPYLLERLNGCFQAPFTLVSASAGFGKSTLVSEWVARRSGDLKSAWLSLERSDNDWMRFYHYLLAAWQHIFPQLGTAAFSEQNTSLFLSTETLINTLLNDLLLAQEADKNRHSVLVLDDYQHIDNQAIHETVTYLVEHLPARCHIILITRTDPPFPMARWRSRRSMLELRADDLRFSTPEVVEFLNPVMQLSLAPDLIETLAARTEGWIVGLQMAALALQAISTPGRQNADEFVRNFGGSQRFVLDYLVEEVVNQQPEDIRQFLHATSLFDKFCGPLCDAVLGNLTPSAQNTLERIEKANLFLIPLDDRRHWFRYHHLFAELLRVRMKQTNPEQFPALYARAAVWYKQNALWPEAIWCAIRIRDYELGAKLLEEAVIDAGTDFLFSGISSLVESFPDQVKHNHPALCLATAAIMIENSQLSGIQELLRSAEQGVATLKPYEGQSKFLGIMYVVQGIAASLLGDSVWIEESSRQVIQLLPKMSKAYVSAMIQLGNVYFFNGSLRDTRSCWEQALEISHATSYSFGILACLDNLARLLCQQGDLNRAETIFQTTLQRLDEDNNRSPRWLAATMRDYSDLLRERNCLDDAFAMMASSLNLSERWETASGRGLGHIHLGRIYLAKGDLPSAALELKKAEEICLSHTVYPDLAAIVAVFRAKLSMASGDMTGAWESLENSLDEGYCKHLLHREWVIIAQAWCLIRLEQPEQALKLLEGRQAVAQEMGRGLNWLEMVLQTALAQMQTGKLDKALFTLKDGLAFAQQQKFVRIFFDEGEPVQQLLRNYLAHGTPPLEKSYVLNLLAGYPSSDSPGHKARKAGEELVEPLTSREREVLNLVCEGLSNQEIAARLVLSVGTVKTHIHNIFGKLGVTSRPQAMTLANQLGFWK